MAKKKSKKNKTRMIISLIIVALAVLTICTMFMSVINVTGKVGILGFGTETTTSISGTDIFASVFHGEVSTDLNAGTNLLVGLKGAEHAGFVTTVFIWGYILTVIIAIAALVFSILSLVGMRFNKVNMLVGVILLLLAIVTFVFGIIVAGKFSAEAGIQGVLSAGSVGSLALGAYVLIATMIGGGALSYASKK